ncbi:MAG: hypothetical protein JRD92_03295 [Deltaproteobacteria bacterium]|nr:hypothetical protein [Deltaproteobacteria bacterium]MBW2585954.1 hypothetical protein [Deltaproteobacteria bacterium]
MSQPRHAWVIGLFCLLGGCEQLGNPQQFATGPTHWSGDQGHLITTTRSFRNEKTILRLVSEGLDDLDHADASIGPSQTLTLVSVVPRKLSRKRRRDVKLVTKFELAERAPIVRRWSAPPSSHHWNAAFALPEPPRGAVTSVAP